MTQIIPSITFNGNAEAAFNFYKDVFGVEFTAFMRWSENPSCDQFSEEDKNKVMHASLPIGSGGIMGNDFVPVMPGQTYSTGNNFTITAAPDSKEEADRLYSRLSEGGTAMMPMQITFWGGYFGALGDKFGVQWMIHFDPRIAG